jgi:transcriptional regulator with XRE-family HTH domain
MTRDRGTGVPSAFDRAEPGFYEALGRAIKVARTQQDVARRELAERAGVSYAYLSDIETGRGRPSSKALLAIAGALGRTPSELLQEAELYGALHDVAMPAPNAIPLAAPVSGTTDERSWFHASTTTAADAFGPQPPPPAPGRPRVPTRQELQRLARSRLAGRAASARDELHAIIDGLSDDDAEMVLQLARRLLGSRP